MKSLKSLTLLSLALSSFVAHADSAEYRECQGEEMAKRCLTYKITFPSYPYPWLTDFVLQESFSQEEAKVDDLDDLVKQYVAENMPQEPSNDSESRDWSGAEETAGFIQVAEISSLNSDGAAHGLDSINYYVFTKENHTQPIPADEIIITGVEDTFRKLLEHAYVRWQIDNKLVENNATQEAHAIIQGFVEDGKMPFSDNWYFAKDMIVFSYAPYEIGPYSYGTVELPLPITVLQGLIKDQYLQAAKEWVTPFQP